MPPKVRFTRAEIISGALDLVREKGMDGLTARALAAKLGSSPKPVFGLFENMEEVQSEVMVAADRLYQQFLAEDMAAGEFPPYKASGMGYIRFAKEERELFKLLFMRDRSGEIIGEDREPVRPLLELLEKELGITEDEAYLFHLEQWIFVHGIATMVATGYLEWDLDFIVRALADSYFGAKHRFTKE